MRDYALERIEWTRVWREQCTTDKPRVLLIGDSIIDACKLEVQKNISDKGYAASSFMTAKDLNNPFYIKELDLLLMQEDYAYKAVYLQFGGHNHQTREKAKSDYINLVKWLREKMPDTPIILSPFTPVTMGNGEADKHDTPVSVTVEFKEYNASVLNLREDIIELVSNAEEEDNLHFFDAYALMLENIRYQKADGVHFDSQGSAILGAAIAKKLLSVLE